MTAQSKYTKWRYVVYPGVVISQTDGQEHYIGASQLMRLYGVDPAECFIFEPAPYWTAGMYSYNHTLTLGLIELRPRYDGDYDIAKRSLRAQ